MQEKKQPRSKKKNLTGMLSTIVLMMLGGCFGFCGAEIIGQLASGNDKLLFIYLALGLLGMYLAFFVQIVVHEAGHLAFGLMSGYRFVSFNVLGFVWQKDEKGSFRVGRMQIAGAGGQCLMAPPDYNGGDFPFTLYNLGGVLINLIAAALCGLLALMIPVTWVRILLVMQAVVGAFSALTNGLPLPMAAIQNDGKNLLCIRKDLHARRAFWVQMSMAAALAQGVRLKDMPEDWFAPFPEEAMSNPIVTAVPVMNAARLMDQLDFPAAEAAIRALLGREKGVLGLYRASLSCDGAVCELLAGRPSDLTASLDAAEIKKVCKAMKNHPSMLRTRYALCLLRDRDAAGAEKVLADFEKAAAKYPNPQEMVGERALIAAIQAADSCSEQGDFAGDGGQAGGETVPLRIG